MKKTIILNAQLSHCIAALGHTDGLTLCDAGLPIPTQVERIDLALTKNIPSFLACLDAIVSEIFVERVLLAQEIQEKSPEILTALLARLNKLEQQQGNRIAIEYVSHEKFKHATAQSKAIVRSGECSPYANIILYSGVPF
ncbi:D-ribose pyranase [Aggregatibacter actinomycetemcomitans]|uniref:D-ribose pyranase n=1 Tax=Aggregatibacter actinomycetemcomitans TaxID=714 RepID=UPI0011D4F2E6|nr:D-ribose pyranase [Aggregatibacter actinomycetemcomitans]QEH44929.1 D-ribose pyranase [Aggregatibacter actinomycetemcomitans]QEH46995.1 D-ribose pyranase [Aggregatibacter actinomycetemcomitans]QEH49924.1 D-ribose pyranase [Aggregatibacter actinomycetemcomitans]TYA48692.1 D-ribose pyranase [Aggregatibacter actinomycetemcomitans]TYA51461.1 D-ribose pyranase [Aggregatibacter actinomycetemcomitans]